MRTIQQIYETLHNRIIAEIQKVNSDMVGGRLGFESPFALSHAAEIRLLELLSEQITLEGNPLTATSRDVSNIGMLEYLGELKNITRKPAQAGVYSAQFAGKEGGIIEAGTVIRTAGGVELAVLNEVEISTGQTAAVEVSTLEAGARFAVLPQESFNLTQNISGIEKKGVILSVKQKAADLEDLEKYRRRVVAAYNESAQGGTMADFRNWARQVEGIIEVYPKQAITAFSQNYTNQKPQYTINTGLGFPSIYIEFENNTPMDEIYSQYLQIISKNFTLCGGQIQLLPCITKKINVSLQTAGGEDWDFIVEQCENLIKDYLKERRPFVEGLDEKNVSQISKTEILYMLNENLHKFNILLTGLNLFVDGSTYNNYTLAFGEIPILNPHNWWK